MHWTDKTDKSYTTDDEISFLRDQALSRPEAFRQYAAVVLGGGRRYDPQIDVAAVELEAVRLLAAIDGVKVQATA